MLNDLRTPFHEWLVELRRHFHQFPELAYEERETAARIAEVLDALRVPYQSGIAGTGVVARLVGARPGPTVALRADMDALPLSEGGEVPYRSKRSGLMHACGHDAHMAMVLGVVRRLVEERWSEYGAGKVIFIFQPAEEGGAGARSMLEAGVFGSEAIEAIFAGHVHPEFPAGHIGLARGVSNAASDTFLIQLTGKGGHGAYPHLCIDPIVAGASLVTQIQTIVSRNVPPSDCAVLTLGTFHAGTAPNIIPHTAELRGTLRTLRREVRELALARLRELLAGLEKSHGVSAGIDVTPGYPLLVNDPGIAEYAARQAAGLLGESHVHWESPRMGAEDFAYFLERWPGVIIRLGCHNPGVGVVNTLHSPYFDLDEGVLDVGVSLFADLLRGYADREKIPQGDGGGQGS